MNIVITDVDTGRVLWTGIDCSEFCGIVNVTWNSYFHAGRVPEPVGKLNGKTLLWDAEEVKAWHEARPGRGRQSG